VAARSNHVAAETEAVFAAVRSAPASRASRPAAEPATAHAGAWKEF
jgi:hypothetical protein